MSEPRSDYRLSFVWSDTGLPLRFTDLESGFRVEPSRTCRGFTREGVARNCAAGIAEIARRSGIDPTRIQGHIEELVPKVTAESPLATALLSP